MKAEDKESARQSCVSQFQTVIWNKREDKGRADLSKVPIQDKETSSPIRR
jgi:hypothetical protein